MHIPALFNALCDDAAVFPPGLKPVEQAVPDHLRHRSARYAALVGPLVLPASAIPAAAAGLGERSGEPLHLTLTVPSEQDLPSALDMVDAHPSVALAAVEVPLSDAAPADAVASVQRVTHGRGLDVFVEVPRDARQAPALDAIEEAGLLAKLRTGGIRQHLYPSPEELAASLAAVISRGLVLKATAGLHHALRNTDPETGFDQHGFLSVLAAVEAQVDGAGVDDVAAILALRDPSQLLALLPPADGERAGKLRSAFRSFGTCSITEPLEELIELGLIDEGVTP